jgi:Fe-S protein assembly co-chaperone HscB
MKNHFKKFSLPIKFEIDLADLEKKYFDLQSQFHPDISGLEDVEESIAINESYKILSDDFNRACYLLLLKGIDIKNDEKAIKPDLSTLEEVLELQEKITRISDKNEIEELRKKINEKIKQLIIKAVECFETLQTELSAQFLVKAKYLKKSLEDLKIRKHSL